MSMQKALWMILAFAGVVAAGPLTGQRAASFTLPDSNSKFHDLLDYRGKVVVIDVMKTDCPHCVTFSRTLERVKARYGDRVQVLSIVTLPDNATTVGNYIAKHKVTSPVLFDSGQATAALLKITPRNPTVTLPTVLVLDQQGIIRADHVWVDGDNSVKPIFEGDGLFSIIDGLLKQGTPGKK